MWNQNLKSPNSRRVEFDVFGLNRVVSLCLADMRREVINAPGGVGGAPTWFHASLDIWIKRDRDAQIYTDIGTCRRRKRKRKKEKAVKYTMIKYTYEDEYMFLLSCQPSQRALASLLCTACQSTHKLSGVQSRVLQSPWCTSQRRSFSGAQKGSTHRRCASSVTGHTVMPTTR